LTIGHKSDPNKHHRRSIRLKGYDYARPGAYYITICTQNRECLFGEIINGRMELNDAGKMVFRWYHELERKFPNIKCDQFVCMPNHVHFILINVGAVENVGTDPRVCPYEIDKQNGKRIDEMGENNDSRCEYADPMDGHADPTGGDADDPTGGHAGPPLPRVVQWFKTMTTNEYINHVKNDHWRPFDQKLWQRNYYEHIVRDETALAKIREYIFHNPENWDNDKNHKKS
jgi:putative transposase